MRPALMATLLAWFSWFIVLPVGADQGDLDRLLATLENAQPGASATWHQTHGGALHFVAAPAGAHFAVNAAMADRESWAHEFVRTHRSAAGVTSPRVELVTRSVRSTVARTTVRLDQHYGGLPVFAAQALIQVGEHGIEVAIFDLLRDTALLDRQARPGEPALTPDAASQIALREIAAEWPAAALGRRGTPRLVVFAPEVLDLDGPAKLSWQVDVAAESGYPAERLLVDALDGATLLRYSLSHSALDRQVFDAEISATVPDDPVRVEGDPASGVVDVDEVYDYSGDTYDFYWNEHGRDGVDDAGSSLISVVRFCPEGDCSEDNAFWDGTQSKYTLGMATDDVVGHEITHGVTQFTSGLIYINQSGAISESLSDIWGEMIDLGNDSGLDADAVRWLIAEDAPTGILRDMEDPPAYGDPDSTCSPLYFDGLGDNGGVHSNSGILNKLASLLVDGGTFEVLHDLGAGHSPHCRSLLRDPDGVPGTQQQLHRRLPRHDSGGDPARPRCRPADQPRQRHACGSHRSAEHLPADSGGTQRRVQPGRADHLRRGDRLFRPGHPVERAGDVDAAEALLRQAIAKRRALGPVEEKRLAESLVELAELARLRGRDEESAASLAEALSIRRRVLPADHPDLLALVESAGDGGPGAAPEASVP